MPTYTKKAQVLFTERQFKDLQGIAKKQKKKVSTLIREAVEDTYLKKVHAQKVRKAADRLLNLAEGQSVEVPFDHEDWETEYSKRKGSISDD
ncbi:MAG: hypothetical protein SVY10_17120 [Thermodesulfobacteriota bacterium]|nr:hypothetical protein [Thermodesulfobacteriota bacterium]